MNPHLLRYGVYAMLYPTRIIYTDIKMNVTLEDSEIEKILLNLVNLLKTGEKSAI
jgi:hypothetical protein